MATKPMTPDEIREAREALNLSQEALGEQFGVTGTTVHRWESGESNVAIPGAVRLAFAKLRIDHALDVNGVIDRLKAQLAAVEKLAAEIERDRLVEPTA